MGTYEVDRMIRPTAVHLKLPAAIKFLPTFHVSWDKTVQESELSPLTEPPAPLRVIDGGPTYYGSAHSGCTLAGLGVAVPGGLGGIWPRGAFVVSP